MLSGLIKTILAFGDSRMETPTNYGWFHLLCLGILALAVILTLVFYKRPSVKGTNRVLLICSVIMLLFEVYKQIIFSYNVSDGSWSYQWYAFPFQFCSTPMYVMFLAALLKKGRLYNCLLAYLATYALLGGLLVMFYPNDVYTSTIGINIQTMVHHGMQVYVGLFLLLRGSVSNKKKTLFRAFAVFLVLVALAMLLNYLFTLTGIDATFNMFYISPTVPCHLPILSIIWEKLPYLLFLLLYILSFTLGGWCMLLIDKLVCKIRVKRS